jgi:hypothetical protein
MDRRQMIENRILQHQLFGFYAVGIISVTAFYSGEQKPLVLNPQRRDLHTAKGNFRDIYLWSST